MLPPWWLAELNEKFSTLKAAKQITKVELAAELTRAAGRKPAWDHKAVERFLDGDVTTIEMMWAFLLVFPSLVQPVFFAPSRRDAEQMIDFLRRGDVTPEWNQRYRELEARLLQIAAPVEDQTENVPSSHERKLRSGRHDHRGAGRVGRGGT